MLFKKPKFWDEKKVNLISFFLLPFTIVIYFSNIVKNFNKKKKFNIKTICVGNIYLGGTGKTPLSIEIFNILKKLKFKVVFIKNFHSNFKYELRLLSKIGPVISLSSRQKSLEIAESKKYDFAIIDDGLQDKTINYDLKIVCFDKENFIGNGKLIPAGPLREGLSNIKNFDVVFLNGPNKCKKKMKFLLKRINNNIKIFETNPKILKNTKIIRQNNYLIFSGIGNPQNFEFLLRKNKFKILKKFEFPDHYDFNDKEIKEIKYTAKKNKLKILTTEKDFLRLKKNQKKNVQKICIKLKIDDSKKFVKILKRI